MEAILDVDNIAHCTIDIEGARVPPTSNFVDSIYMQDGGFGCPIPLLQLVLNDQISTLDEDLNLQDGTLVTIKLSKQREQVKTRKFRMFSFKKQTTAAGPKMVVTCLFDAPKWVAGVYTESYRGSSDSVIGQIAAAAGLEYDGAGGTDDVMTWLNINKTRTAFSEDIAMRGYASGQSCMYRVLTLDGKVKYKDLFKVLGESPKWTLHQNTDEATATGTPIVIRETQNASASGLTTHMMNYGQSQYEHSLDVAGQKNTMNLDAPVFGSALPINADVKGEIAERGARVNYTGWDTGTEPKPASNLHQYYEPAIYQNFRYLGLMSERINVLTDEYTETEVFDCANYKHAERENNEFREKKALAGNWLIGGRTIWIKAGHKYCEIYFLYRPTLMETGASSAAGAAEQSGSQQNAKANEGPIDLVAEQQATTPTPPETPPAPPETAVNNKPAIENAKSTLNSLSEYAQKSPLTSPPVLGSAVNGDMLAAENVLRQNVNALKSSGGPLADAVSTNASGPMSAFMTVKKFGADTIKAIAGRQITLRDAARMADDPAYFKATAISRATNVASDITGVRMHNIVSAASGGRVNVGGIIGDVMTGGLWGDDLRAAGISPNQIALEVPDLPILDNAAIKAGGAFLYNATGLGMSENQILINPYQTARNIERWAKSTNPEAMLLQDGYRAYTQTFGNITPTEATTSMADVAKLAGKVALMYSQNEVLTDQGLTDYQIREIGRDVAFTFGDPTIVPVVNSVENIARYAQYHDVQSRPTFSTWADYYSMGADAAEAVGQWEFPFNFPAEGQTQIGENTNGNSNTFPEDIKQWLG